MADVPDVAVHRIRAILLDRDGNAALFCVVNFLLAGLDVPDAPRCDNLHVRVKRLDGQLEADLVVALAGAAVADGSAVLLVSDFDEALGNQRPCEGRAQQILALVDRARLERRPNEVLDELLAQVFDIQLFRAALFRLLVEGLEFLALPDVARNADHIAVIIFLQPRHDNRGIQTTGISQQYAHLRHNNRLLYLHPDFHHFCVRLPDKMDYTPR